MSDWPTPPKRSGVANDPQVQEFLKRKKERIEEGRRRLAEERQKRKERLNGTDSDC